MKKLVAGVLFSGALFGLYGCQSAAMRADAPKVNNDDLYEVAHDGRYYVFDDFQTYRSFIEVGETAYRKVFIGGGPEGRTLVFGLRGEDKKKLDGIAAVEMYHDRLEAADGFYGEMRGEDGRLYVFSRLEDMAALRQVGEAPYRFTQIGAGPESQTVVFVLNKENKKRQPTELVARFKQRYGL